MRERRDRLGELAHELRRPEADFLRDGIYELRASYQRVRYRMLYFFAGKAIVVLSRGLTKDAKCRRATSIKQSVRGRSEPI